MVFVLPNGGGESVGSLATDTWREALLSLYQNASRISLWSAAGQEVAFVARCMEQTAAGADCERCSDKAGSNCEAWVLQDECANNPGYMKAACTLSCGACASQSHSRGELPAGDEPLYAVVDHFPFVWPSSVGTRSKISIPGGDALTLHARSSSPRVFEIEDVASAEECAAIMRLSMPVLRQSVTFEGGKQVTGVARTSANGWLQLPSASAVGDAAMLRAVWLRLAGAVRLDPAASENMQAIRYEIGGHYFYHTDTGGSPAIQGRAITALLYLTDGFEGGETSFPLAGTGETRNNVHRIREEFHNCDPTAGLAVKPRAGSATIFYNLLPNTRSKDFSAWHASCDVLSQEPQKHAANLWFHLHKAEDVHSRQWMELRRF